MSYNVENLFDTINDPENDDDFTPNGKLNWNTKRYQEKLNHIAQVVEAVKTENGNQWPMVIGLIEVEHASCLNDLVSKTCLNDGHYQVAFVEGEDERGIDVGLLYRSDLLKVIEMNAYKVALPENDKTRHILEVVAQYKKDTFVFYVNHWPSRSGGTEKSAPLRMMASETLRNAMTKRRSVCENCNVVAMGDFNDYPGDSSLLNLKQVGGRSYSNVMQEGNLKQKGSHFYKGEWGFLDQFIVSAEMMLPERKGWSFRRVEAVGFDFMMYTNSKGEMSPARTYVGDSYKGGYSDHLPILLELNDQK
jgi:predicted extracellular nuclease